MTSVKPLFAYFRYYTIVWLEERKSTPMSGVERRVALLLRGEQTLDKERGTEDVRSDTCVLNNGPTQVQLIRGVL